MEFQTERRFSPRVPTDFSLRLLPADRECTALNISEAGICLESEDPTAHGDIFLSMNSFPFKSTQRTEIPAKVVWHKSLGGNKSQLGVQFSPLDQGQLSQIKDLIFDHFAKKVLEILKDHAKDATTKAEDFFARDVRQYCENLSALARELGDKETTSQEIEQKLTALTNDLLFKGNALEELVNHAAMKKIKRLFRELTGCWFYQSPIMKMAYEKPRGYPGDYELFETIYNGKPLAKEGTIGFYFDQYFLSNTYTKAVRTRKNKMKNILQDLIETNDSSRLRLLNVACGPCREIRELLSDPLLASKANICFTGLDNDEGALMFSKSALAKAQPNVTLKFLHENVLGLFRDDKYYDIIGKQDVIYILGLTEYLPDRIFKKLTRFLSQLLDDNGTLVITYKDRDIAFPSLPPDWLCDWAFIKRSKDDLVKAAEGLGLEKYSLRVEKEGTETIFFLMLKKS